MSVTTAPTPDQAGRWVVSSFGPPSVLQWSAFPSSLDPSVDEVLIRILVAGISGVDNLQRAGGYPDPRCAEPGFCPGYDCVGVVEKIGSKVSGVRQDEIVVSMCILGAHATHILLPATDVVTLEQSDDLMKMAALPLNYMTAYGMLKRSQIHLKSGSSILIGSASGGVGTAVAQLVNAFGLELTMFGTCSSSKFEYLKSLGVIPIDRRSQDVAAQVRKMNHGQGVDIAFDAVGSKDSLETSANAIKQGGGVVVISFMSSIASDGSGMVSSDFNTYEHVSKHPSMSFFSVVEDYYKPQKTLWMSDFREIAQAVRTGRLDPMIAKVFKLSEAIQAHEQIICGQGVTGKMLFLVDSNLAASQGL
jgi:NADPH:quinone reductase